MQAVVKWINTRIDQRIQQSPLRTHSTTSRVDMNQRQKTMNQVKYNNQRKSLVVIQNNVELVSRNPSRDETFTSVDNTSMVENVSVRSDVSIVTRGEDTKANVDNNGPSSGPDDHQIHGSTRTASPLEFSEGKEENPCSQHVHCLMTDDEKSRILSLDMTAIKTEELYTMDSQLEGYGPRIWKDTFVEHFGSSTVEQDIIVAPVLTERARVVLADATGQNLEAVEPDTGNEMTLSGHAVSTILENMVTAEVDIAELESQRQEILQQKQQLQMEKQQWEEEKEAFRQRIAELEIRNNELETTRNTSLISSANSSAGSSLMKVKLGKLDKYNGKTAKEFDVWLSNFQLWSQMAGYEGPNKTVAFLTYLGTEASSRFCLEMESRFPGDFRNTDWPVTEKMAWEILGGKPSRQVDALAEAYSYYQGQQSVEDYYWTKKRMLIRANNGEMPLIQMDAAILAHCTRAIQLETRNITDKATLLEMLREAESRVNNAKERKKQDPEMNTGWYDIEQQSESEDEDNQGTTKETSQELYTGTYQSSSSSTPTSSTPKTVTFLENSDNQENGTVIGGIYTPRAEGKVTGAAPFGFGINGSSSRTSFVSDPQITHPKPLFVPRYIPLGQLFGYQENEGGQGATPPVTPAAASGDQESGGPSIFRMGQQSPNQLPKLPEN